ncbi:recombinase family protein [Candidatus Dependentiae bacterium]|nr:recombinase family protein [Candidatus Dependentiae bacterium]
MKNETKNNTPKKGLAFLRVSTQKQEDNYSYSMQQSACEKLAADNNIEIVKIIKEQVSGAESLKNRPGVNEMLSILKDNYKTENHIDYILILNRTRLSRDVSTGIFLEKKIIDYGAKILSHAEPTLENNDPFSNAMRNFIFTMSQLEKELVSSRLLEGRRQKHKTVIIQSSKRKGVGFCGSCTSTGYQSVNGLLVVDPKYATFIKDIVRKIIVENKSVYSIVKELNRKIEDGEPDAIYPKRGGKRFTVSGILYILKNETLNAVSKFDGLRKPGCHQSIISKRQRNQIIEILNQRKSA